MATKQNKSQDVATVEETGDVATVVDSITVEELRERILNSVESVAVTRREQLAIRMADLRLYVTGLTREAFPALFNKSGDKLVMDRVYRAITDDGFAEALRAVKADDSVSRATLDRYWKASELILSYGLPITVETASGAYRATESAEAMRRLRSLLDAVSESGPVAIESFDKLSRDAKRAADEAMAADKVRRAAEAAEAAEAATEADDDGEDAPPPSVEQLSEIVRRVLDRAEGNAELLTEYRRTLRALVQYEPGSVELVEA